MTQPRPRSTSWEVRVAAVMVGAGVLLGAGLVALSVRMFTMDPGFLFAIMPIVVSFVLGAGLYIALGSVMLVVSLHRRTRTARCGGGHRGRGARRAADARAGGRPPLTTACGKHTSSRAVAVIAVIRVIRVKESPP